MIFENSYGWGQFIGDIIGGLIATIVAILTWYLIEQLKKKQESNKIKEAYQQFYDKISEFDFTEKEKADLIKAEIIHLIIYEIGIENISKVLKFRYRYQYGESMGHVYTLESSLWQMNVQSGIGLNAFNIKRYDGVYYHFDERSNQNLDVRNEFVNYVKEECKKAKINLT